jgi:FkbM family methyltransferase
MKESVYYGQHGEDAILSGLFPDDYSGYFVEVGALEGIRFSNTYLFEQRGWNGIVIEAHPGYFELLKENRNCKVIHVAVGDKDREECAFYANFRGSLSTLNENINFSNYGKYWGQNQNKIIDGFVNGKIKVPMAKLDTVLEKEMPPSNSIDIMSIDIDGSESVALKAFDIKRWKPRVIIFEISTVPEVIYSFMEGKGYILARKLGCNVIYSACEQDAQKIRNAQIVIPQADNEHPCDKTR